MRRLVLACTLAVSFAQAKPPSSLCRVHKDREGTSRLFFSGNPLVERMNPDTIRAFACMPSGALVVDTRSVVQYTSADFYSAQPVSEGFAFPSGIAHAGILDHDSVWFISGRGTVGIAYLNASGTPGQVLSNHLGSPHVLLDNDGLVKLSCTPTSCRKISSK